MTRMLFLVLSVLLVSACSTPLTVPVPQGRFDVPETVGNKKIAVAFSAMRDTYNVTLTPSAGVIPVASVPPVVTISETELVGSFFKLTSGMRFDASYGVSKRLEFGTAMWNTGIYAKYQILGKSQIQAKKGDTSLAVIVKAQFPQHSYSASGGNSFDYQGNGYDTALLGGYRL